MTVLVILHHTAITYGAIGGWWWQEIQPNGSISSLLLILFCTTNQAYFMGFFFLLAGYFTPPSLERKGYARFIVDRFIRLGLPLVAFIVILGPVTSRDCHSDAGQRALALITYSSCGTTSRNHQRAAVVCAGAVDLQPWLLRVACGGWCAACRS